MTPIGLDTGVCVPDDATSGEPRLAKHRVVFWPARERRCCWSRISADRRAAVFGEVRHRSQGRQCVELGRDTSRPAFLPRAFPSGEPAGSRLLAAYYDRPLFPENFSANEAYDEWSGRGLDDWVTYYEGATRLVEYLQYVGYNGLIMTVLADGSADLSQPVARTDAALRHRGLFHFWAGSVSQGYPRALVSPVRSGRDAAHPLAAIRRAAAVRVARPRCDGRQPRHRANRRRRTRLAERTRGARGSDRTTIRCMSACRTKCSPSCASYANAISTIRRSPA